MFGLSGGEIFIVAFVTVAVVSARYWPALGERIAVRLSRAETTSETDSAKKPSTEDPPRE
ncbi:MAG TPA: hypothetical protein VHV51_24755 [Polyangiaceae bacterium]|jgi:hypothetical protein|nr:hypothetical protein [Polyangiaceae bacterium]